MLHEVIQTNEVRADRISTKFILMVQGAELGVISLALHLASDVCILKILDGFNKRVEILFLLELDLLHRVKSKH